ncbi:MAG: tail fiber protein [Pirellulales bacterium]
MAEAFLGEIRIFAGNFAPQGWAYCDGSLLPIDQNEALSSVLGTKFGGDGTKNFALPNLNSRVPMHWGIFSEITKYQIGDTGGDETVTLGAPDIPFHTHPAQVTSQTASEDDPKPDGVMGAGLMLTSKLYAPNNTPLDAPLHASALAPAGGNMPHNNQQPYLRVSFILCLEGIYPAKP